MIASKHGPGSLKVIAGLAVAACLVCGLTAMAALRLWPNSAKPIAFVSYQDGNREIYLVDVEALLYKPIRITDNAAPDSDPVWSPDGTLLAFVSTRDGDHEIYLTNVDGSQVVQVTHNDALDWRPSWSPDGSRLLFESEQDENFEIYFAGVDLTACAMPAQGCISTPVRLTHHPAVDSYPTWSPDGSRIAFQSNRHGNFDIYVMPAPGLSVTGRTGSQEPETVNLTRDPAGDWFATWSPDGRYIAFESDRDYNREIYAIDAGDELAQPIRITNHAAVDTAPRWSPDGKQIAFVSNRDHNDEIYLVPFDGLSVWTPDNLTHTAVSDRNPIWSPDGQQIAFESYGSDQFGVFVMKTDGSERTQITFSSRGDRQIAWKP